MKYVEKGIIVEDVDECMTSSAGPTPLNSKSTIRLAIARTWQVSSRLTSNLGTHDQGNLSGSFRQTGNR